MRRGWFLWVLLGLVLGYCSNASAQNSTILPNGAQGVTYVNGGTQYVDPTGTQQGRPIFQGRDFTNAAPSRNVNAVETYQQRLGGNTIGTSVGRIITPANVARAAVRGAGAAGAIKVAWDTGTAIGDEIANALDLGTPNGGARGVPDGSGDWQYDEGMDPGSSLQSCYIVDSLPCVVGKLNACQTAYADGVANGRIFPNPSRTYTVELFGGGGTHCRAMDQFGSQLINWQPGIQTVQQQMPNPCAAYIDALNPAWSNSSPVPGPDGRCPTGRYTAASAQQAASIENWIFQNATADELRDLIEPILDKGGSIDASPRELSPVGATSFSGEPSVTTTTTTSPGGGSTTTSATSTPHVSYTFSGDTVTYNTYTTVVTTTTNNVTQESTTTETTDDPAEESVSDPFVDPNAKSECEKFPDSVGCSKLGTLPTDAPVWQTRDVPFAEENLGFGAGSCPPANTWSVFGLSLTWGYQPICDVAPFIRVAFLLMASIAAIGIVIKETA